MTVIDLSTLDGADGFRLDGIDAYDRSGRSVSGAGDVNGDGFADLIVGAFGGDPNGDSYAGESYVVFGKASGFTAGVDLASLDGTDGFRLDGIDSDDRSGLSVSGAGDVNGDGFDDLIIGAEAANPNGDSYAGESYVVFGKASGFTAGVDLASLDGADGFRLDGIDAYDRSGRSVSGAGDVNGDGFDDLIVGADSADPNGDSAAGESYVVFGKASGFTAGVDLASLDGTDGFRLDGIDGFDYSGQSVSGAGDVNGDGFDDLIVGAHGADPNGVSRAGESYVVFGKASGFTAAVGLASLDGADGFRLDGIDANDRSGRSVSGAGDVNGDGFADLIIGAYRADPNGDLYAGESYVVFGKASGFTAGLDLASLDGTDGFRIDGIDADDLSGGSVSGAGDVNGDGFDDLIVGAERAAPNGDRKAGESYVVFGQASGFTAGVDLASLDGTDGFRLDGIDGFDYSGVSVSGAGDVDGDGFADLIVGAPGGDPNGDSYAGASYVVFGFDSGAVTHQGTAANETLTGDAGANVIIGDLGDDLLVGVGGADVLRGGAGDDILSVADLTFADADGGAGTDTLRLAGADLTLDLTAAGDEGLSGIEAIDFASTGGGLTLNARSVLALSDTSNAVRVTGDGDDTVTFSDSGWTQVISAATTTFRNGQATLVVDAGIQIASTTAIPIASIALDALNGANGFRLDGIDSGDRSGRSVSGAGDVNGDGFDDLIIGAYGADPNGDSAAGESYVVFGKASGFTAGLDLASMDGTDGFRLDGIDSSDLSGISVSGAGDVNGDGFADLIVGGHFADPNGDSYAGESYVVFGKASGFTAAVDLASLDGTDGFRLDGIDADDRSGLSVSGAGDVNGDGFADLIIGAYRAAPNGDSFAGESYVVFGQASGFSAGLDLASLDGADGFRLDGIDAGHRSGRSVSGAGDVNGDGFDDLIVGANSAAPNGNFSAGESYVVFGKASGFTAGLDLASLDGTDGFRIDGIDSDDLSGFSVSGAGDVNGDGFADLIIGAYRADPNGDSRAGESYVVFGKASGFTAGVDLASLDGTDGFRLDGIDANDQSGRSVSSAGDVNGDGFDDLIIGADGGDPNGDSYAGESYVVFGKASGFTAGVDLASLDGTDGFRLDGIDAYDRSGGSVSGAGDVNGDGFDDLIVGAERAAPNGDSAAGESYVVFGFDSGAVTHQGTAANETLTGDGAANVIIGDLGDDLLVGAGGADVFRGGAGDDILSVADLTFADADGGAGTDTLRLAGAGLTLDLTAAGDEGLSGIEAIDFASTGGGLTLNARSVLALSDTSNAVRVTGDGDDTVTFSDSGWTQVISAATTTTFRNGQATLVVDAGIQIASAAAIPIAGIALDALNGANGFRLDGIDASDYSGRSVSSAGDVNGDGFADLIVGAYGADPNGDSNAGESYVVFGKASGFTAAVDLASLDGTDGFRLDGIDAGDRNGNSVSGAGDVNGDGFADLIVGAFGADPNGDSFAGESYVVFGKASGFTAGVDLASLDGTNGFRLDGIDPIDRSGFPVSGAGDVNGDGFDDLIVGAYGADPNGDSLAGESYVVFGKASGFTAGVDLAGLDGSDGFRLDGIDAGDRSGRSVSGAGDVNGDGFADLIVGAFGADPNGDSSAGESYVVFGKASGFTAGLDLASLDGTDGFRLDGIDVNDNSGVSVSGAGDVNGDGFADLIIGAYRAAPNGDSEAGESYVVFGKASGFTAGLDLASLDGTDGFRLDGIDVNDNSGVSVSGAGDVNGDGFADLIIGANFADPNGNSAAGESYVVFGKASGFTAGVDLASLDGTDGFRLDGIDSYDRSGVSVSGAGDVNGDGFDDLIVGANRADPNGDSDAGESYVVFGFDSGAVTHQGTSAAETLTGDGGANVIIGDQGDDVLIGGGGADALRGGEGDDILDVTDLGFRRIDGGAGTDTLRLTGAGLSLDLTAAGDEGLSGIEAIDFASTGGGVTLTALSLLALSDASNTLTITGSGDDTVTFSDGGWRQETGAATTTFRNGQAVLVVDNAVQIASAAGITAVNIVLEALDGADGFRLDGIDSYDASGVSVSGAGDVNGDGFADLIVGAYGGDPNGDANAGESYVVFGKASGFTAGVDLASLDGTDGFRLDGIDASDNSGASVSGAGDVNGDGFDDLIIGAFRADPNGDSLAGESYVVFGKASGFTAGVDLASLDGSDGFRLDGIDAGDFSGRSVSGAGDVNGDGFDDLIVGAFFADPNGDSYAGESYVVFGKASGFTAAVDLASLDGTNGFRLDGIDADDRSGRSVSGAGDVNGDGFADLIVGAYRADPNGDSYAGESYVVFGKASGFTAGVDLASLDGTDGFRLDGIDGFDYSGRSVSGAGDVNGDGFDDLIVGANGADPNGDSRAGESYVVFGKASGFTVGVDLASLDGTDGFRLDGIDSYDRSGFSVSGAGDVNGDGFADLIVGAEDADPNGDSFAGESYVVFGKASGFTASIDLASLDGTDGFRLDGIDGFDQSGVSVSGAGDVNGDGFDDLIVGANRADPNGDSQAGESYVVFGFDSGAVTHQGTSAAETLTGDGGANVIIGDQGDDVLIGGGGADALRGGEGDDILDVADLGFRRIDGGAGADTLRLSGTGLSLDFTAVGSQLASGIEAIALTGAGAGATLDRLSILNLSDTSNSLAVSGDTSTRLTLADEGWSLTADNGATHAFANGAASLVIGDDVARTITGSGAADTLLGGAGDDVLAGGSGVDVLAGGAGNDSLTGGDGVDTADYSGASGLIVVNLTSGAAQDGDGGSDTLASIENVIGTGLNDILIGNSAVNVLTGGAGIDRLDGRGGDDVMIGGLGNDLYTVTDTGDAIIELVGEGTDRINAFVDFTNPDNVELLVGKFASVGLTLTGNGTRDQITGANKINSPDSIFGLGGNDLLVGLVGDDVIDGGAGNDRIFGNSGADVISGGLGNDRVTGQQGADTLLGGDGDDILAGGAGDDSLTGGDGFDTADYSDAAGLVSINLSGGAAQDGDGGADTLTSIENVIGTDFNDVLIGDAAVNTLTGGAGVDRLDGRGGDDVMIGGAGNDIYTVTDTGDAIIELVGGGTDRINAFVDFTNPDNVELLVGKFASVGLTLTGNATKDQITGANKINSPDAIFGLGGNDLLVGLVGDDVIDGGAGNDRIFGNSGADVISGGLGNDRVTGQQGADTFVHVISDGRDRITDFNVAQDLLDLTGHGFSNFAEVQALMSDVAGDALIDLAGSDSVLLQGVAFASIGSEDVLI